MNRFTPFVFQQYKNSRSFPKVGVIFNCNGIGHTCYNLCDQDAIIGKLVVSVT